MHPGLRARANLPADAGGGKAGDGAVSRRAVAAARLDRARESAGRADHRADRGAARTRCVTAAAEGRIHSVRMITRKPPRSLLGAPYLDANGISLEGLNGPKLVFSGTAREGAAGFPANVNVAAALALAGIGPDRTMMEIWA